MTVHHDSALIAASCEQVFDLVTDVERYPEFLTLWRDARVIAHEADGYTTEQEVGFGPVHQRFRTHTLLKRPEWIDVTSDDPLFSAFRIYWRFAPVRNHCRVSIDLTWRVRSLLLQTAIDTVLPMTARQMVEAFVHRANAVLPNGARSLDATAPGQTTR